MPKDKPKGTPEVQSITFRPAKGGLVAECSRKYRRGGQGGGPDFDYDTETSVHSDIGSAMNYLKENLQGMVKGKAASEASEEKGEE